MTTMITEVYQAFKKAGVPEAEAQAAAEALSSENLATKEDMRKLDKELLLIKWMLGIVIAATVLPALKQIL